MDGHIRICPWMPCDFIVACIPLVVHEFHVPGACVYITRDQPIMVGGYPRWASCQSVGVNLITHDPTYPLSVLLTNTPCHDDMINPADILRTPYEHPTNTLRHPHPRRVHHGISPSAHREVAPPLHGYGGVRMGVGYGKNVTVADPCSYTIKFIYDYAIQGDRIMDPRRQDSMRTDWTTASASTMAATELPEGMAPS